MPTRLWRRCRLLLVAVVCAGCQSTSLLPLNDATQKLLTVDVGQAIDSKISKAILRKHYDTQEIDEIYCVHKQTHLRMPKDTTRLILYAKMVCAESSPGASPNNKRQKDLSNLIRLPIRIEIEMDGKDFEIVAWQFPGRANTYAEDAARIFPPRLLPEITSTVMDLEHFDRLREKADAAER